MKKFKTKEEIIKTHFGEGKAAELYNIKLCMEEFHQQFKLSPKLKYFLETQLNNQLDLFKKELKLWKNKDNVDNVVEALKRCIEETKSYLVELDKV